MAQLRIPPSQNVLAVTLFLVLSVSSLCQAADKQFNCPEQFGYYPDTDDCSKYFVCVFGDALHESCTGGLYFSVELQTCDWPRNVECANGYKPPVPKEAPPASSKDESFSANRRTPPSNANKPRSTRPSSVSQGRSAGNLQPNQGTNTRSRYADGEDDFDSSRNGPIRNVDARTTIRTTQLPRTTPNTIPVAITTPLPSAADSDLPTPPVTTSTALQIYKDTPDYETGTSDTTTPSSKDSLDSLEDAGADPPNNRFPGYDPQQPQFEEAVPSVVDSEGRIHIPDGLYSNGPNHPGVSDISVFVKPIYENDERDENDRKNTNTNNEDDTRHRKPASESSPYVTPIYSNNGGSRDHDADRVITNFRNEDVDAHDEDDDEIVENEKPSGRNPIPPEINSNNGNHKEPEEEVNRYYRTSGSQDGRDPRDRATTVVQIYNPRDNGPYPRLQSTHNYDNRPPVRFPSQPALYEEPTVYREPAPAPAPSYREQTTGNHYGEVPQNQPQGRPVSSRELNLREPVREIVAIREEPIRETTYREQAPPRAVYEESVRDIPNRGPSYRNQPDQIRKRTTTTTTTTTTTPKPIVVEPQLNREGSRYSTSNRNRNSYRAQDRNRQPNKEIPLQYVSTRHRQNQNQNQPPQPNYEFTENPVRTDYNIYATPKPEVTEAPYEYGKVPYGYAADQYETDDEKAVFVATRARSTQRPTSRATRPRTTAVATTTPAPTTPARSNRRPMPTGLNRPATRPPSTEPKLPPKPPSRPVNRYPTPAPFSTATKCNTRNCKLPDCRCGGTDIPGGIPSSDVPQVVLLTFDDAINELNYDLYEDIFTTRKNPNGCPILGTFYVSHEWTDYGKVQTMYAQGHEMASHSVTHSYGEKFSKSQWHKEINGQREILHLYGGVNLEDVRGMRAPFLQIGGNKMFEMLHEANFTYDSSMPVFENNPPFWPYTTDYAINHECMITPCPTKSFPGIWEVGMVMWIDLRGGRCSMGDACSNPTDEDGVYKMLIKNFNRHYKSNRAPFGLYYHSAWFSTQHHRKGFFKFLDEINAKDDVWLITNWQLIQWMRNPTPSSKINSFEPWQCKPDPKKPPLCRNPTVCNVWDRGGVRYMKTCQPCPSKYPWVGKTGFENRSG